ncbi:MAG: bleomycin resistance protein [Gemmataceae bacterium]|nr:bleomycin resistance protein [Gemmataceae bacterium]
MQPPTAELPALSLIVLQSSNIEAAKDFYALLGLSFAEEQHGRGPRHYACILGSVVFEIYPRRENAGLAATRIGFRVPALDRTVDAIRSRGMRILREATDSPWGRRAVVEDPDGNCVELTSLS